MEKINNTSVIEYSDEIPSDGEGILIHYENLFIRANGWKLYDVRETIKENENEWFSDIEAWHTECMGVFKDSTQWWSLFPASRLLLWESPGLKPILFAAAISQLALSKKNTVIRVIKPSKELISLLKESSLSLNYLVIDKNMKKNFSNYIEKINCFFLNCQNNLRLIIKIIWISRFKKKSSYKFSDVIVNSTLMNSTMISKIGDHYFGHIFEKNNQSSLRVSWLYNDLFFERKKTENEMRKINRDAYFISDMFDFQDLVFCIKNGYESLRNVKKNIKKVPSLRINNLQSSIFPKLYLSKVLVFSKAPFIELLFYNRYKKIFNNSRSKYIFYPYEEKTLERAINLAIKASNRDIKSVAFAHATYSMGNFYIRRNSKLDFPSPDLIALTGPLAKKRFVSFGVKDEKLIHIGSPRYVERQFEYSLEKSSSKLKVLFITSYGFELTNFSDLLVNNVELSEKFSIYIRRSFHSWSREQDEAERKLLDNDIKYQKSNADLISEIDKVDVVVYEATTAAFQASLRGKIIVQHQLSDILPTDHFFGLNKKNKIIFTKNADELISYLDYINSLNANEYKMYASSQRKQVEMVLSSLNYDSFLNLFGK